VPVRISSWAMRRAPQRGCSRRSPQISASTSELV
jgi:hypothetical protein